MWVTNMIYFSAVGMVNALGNSNAQIAASLTSGAAPGMSLQEGWLTEERPVWLGAVTGELPAIPGSLSAHRSRNNQLLLAALAQIESQVHAAVSRYGKDRVAVIMGTSTSGIAEGEEAVRHLHRHGQFPSQRR